MSCFSCILSKEMGVALASLRSCMCSGIGLVDVHVYLCQCHQQSTTSHPVLTRTMGGKTNSGKLMQWVW